MCSPIDVRSNLTSDRDRQLEKLLQGNYYLYRSALEGYRSYLHAYNSYANKKIFDINALDLQTVSKSFGFVTPPKVSISPGSGSESSGKKRKRDHLHLESDNEDEGGQAESSSGPSRTRSKARQIEQLGRKKVAKQHFRKEAVDSGWSR